MTYTRNSYTSYATENTDYLTLIVITVPYIAVNIYNYSKLVVLVTNNLIGLVFSGVGRRDLGIYFGNKLGP